MSREKLVPVEDRPKIGFVVGFTIDDVAPALLKYGWREISHNMWQTPRGDKVHWAPNGRALSAVLKKNVVYFCDGWKQRKDAAALAVHLARVGCQTLALNGESMSLHSVRIDTPARKKDAMA